jgi:hypothetical protein
LYSLSSGREEMARLERVGAAAGPRA